VATVQNPFRQVMGPLPDTRWRPEEIALVVVDMQYFDAHPDWGEGLTAKRLGVFRAFDEYFVQIDEIIPRIQSLLNLCRQQGIEVVHLRVAELTMDSRDVGRKNVVRGLAVPRHSKEAELLQGVAAVEDEIVISKSSSGAFATTNLDRILRNLGITTLIFTGTSTGGCVESTAREAADLGYDVIVVPEACADSTRRSHEIALQRMAALDVRTRSLEEVRDTLAALAPVDRNARSGVGRAEACIPKAPLGTSQTRSPYDLIFGPAVDLPLPIGGTALLILDAHRYVCDPSVGLGKLAADQGKADAVAPFYARVQTAVDHIARLLSAARSVGLLIVYVRTAAHRPDGGDLAPRLRAKGWCPVLGSPDAEILPRLAPLPGEIVLSKPASGICAGTGVDQLLRNAGVETVILTGVSFDGGLEGSIRSLTDRGYGVVVAPDACATYDEQLQAALWHMETGITKIFSTDDVVNRLALAGAGTAVAAARRASLSARDAAPFPASEVSPSGR
jgi:nicotinamidase-related amidase